MITDSKGINSIMTEQYDMPLSKLFIEGDAGYPIFLRIKT